MIMMTSFQSCMKTLFPFIIVIIIVDVVVTSLPSTTALVHPLWTTSTNSRRLSSASSSSLSNIHHHHYWNPSLLLQRDRIGIVDNIQHQQQQHGTHYSSPTQLSMLIGSSFGGKSSPPINVRDELGCSPTLTVLVGGMKKILSRIGPQSQSTTSDNGTRRQQQRQSQGWRRRRRTSSSYYDNDDDDDSPYFFDPFGLANDYNFAEFREAELKHGRISMIGVVSCMYSTYSIEDVVGIITRLQDDSITNLQRWWYHWIDGPLLSSSMTVSGIAAADGNNNNNAVVVVAAEDVIKTDPTPTIQSLPLPSPFTIVQDWTWSDVGRMILFCGFLEIFVLVQIDPQAMPGDYNIGYWGTRDKGRNERSLICELENGRLAMMVMLLYVLSDVWKLNVDRISAIQEWFMNL